MTDTERATFLGWRRRCFEPAWMWRLRARRNLRLAHEALVRAGLVDP